MSGINYLLTSYYANEATSKNDYATFSKLQKDCKIHLEYQVKILTAILNEYKDKMDPQYAAHFYCSRAATLQGILTSALEERAIRKTRKDCEKILEDFESALKLQPNHAITFIHRAKLYRSIQEYSLSIKDFSRFIELSPKEGVHYGEACYNLAACIMVSGGTIDVERVNKIQYLFEEGQQWEKNYKGPKTLEQIDDSAANSKKLLEQFVATMKDKNFVAASVILRNDTTYQSAKEAYNGDYKKACTNCGKITKTLKCSQCLQSRYCSVGCQKKIGQFIKKFVANLPN